MLSQNDSWLPYPVKPCLEGSYLAVLQHKCTCQGILSFMMMLQASERQDAGWLNPIVNTLDQILSNIQTSLDSLHVPYSYGWSIILLTLLTKVFTFPFTKIQVTFQDHSPALVNLSFPLKFWTRVPFFNNSKSENCILFGCSQIPHKS